MLSINLLPISFSISILTIAVYPCDLIVTGLQFAVKLAKSDERLTLIAVNRYNLKGNSELPNGIYKDFQTGVPS